MHAKVGERHNREREAQLASKCVHIRVRMLRNPINLLDRQPSCANRAPAARVSRGEDVGLIQQHTRRTPAHRPRLGGVFRGRDRVHRPSDRQAFTNLRPTTAASATPDTAVCGTELEPRTSSRAQPGLRLTPVRCALGRLIMGRALGPQVGLTLVQFTAVRQLGLGYLTPTLTLT